jgi:histidine triad (HIT) family protein
MEETIFEKIIQKKIPAKIVYEDEDTLAFHDIAPVAPIHILIIPKTKLVSLNDVNEKNELVLGKIFHTVKKVAELLGIENSGYRTVINTGKEGGQTVFYLHCHLLGGHHLGWPPC